MSGKAFHSGRLAFSAPRDLYILGLNPGGDPEDRSETVASNIEQVRHEAEDWCAFLDQDCQPSSNKDSKNQWAPAGSSRRRCWRSVSSVSSGGRTLARDHTS